MVFPVLAAAAGLGTLGAIGTAKLSQDQANRQMDFQERLSGTAYQRAAADLEAAGLNRILALGSPASTPSGAMGTVPDISSSMANALTSSSQVMTEKQQRKLMASQGVQAEANAKQAAASEALLKEQKRSEKARADVQSTISQRMLDGDQAIEDMFRWGGEKAGATAKYIEEQMEGMTERIDSMLETIKDVYKNTNPNPLINENLRQWISP